MSLRLTTVAVLLALALTFTAASAAKEFKPGDLRICNANTCVTITDQRLLDALGSFIYMGPQPAIVRSPRLGVAYFALKFRNGYVPGIVATAELDRWLSYGVYLGRFARGRWYHVPARTAAGVRELTVSLKPLRLTRVVVRRSR
jgi:hypothetical protein